MYIINELSDFRLVSTGTYFLVPTPIFVQKSPVYKNNYIYTLRYIL